MRGNESIDVNFMNGSSSENPFVKNCGTDLAKELTTSSQTDRIRNLGKIKFLKLSKPHVRATFKILKASFWVV